jgi:hypothetical protein
VNDQTTSLDPELLVKQVAEWQAAGVISTGTASRLRRHIQQPLRAPAAVVEPADGQVNQSVVGVEKAISPPRAAASHFSWRTLGESLLAERTLNTLLGLGAFLILTSALVISIFNPTRLSIVPHLGVLAGTTALFYTAGWFCYARMRLPRVGEALLGIAAALVPLDVLSAGGAEGLGWSTTRLWLVGSMIALPVYAASYYLLPGRVFGWLTAVAIGSLLQAALASQDVPPAWQLCSLVPLAIAYITVSSRLKSTSRWQSLSVALFWTAQIVTPPVLLALLLVGRDDIYAVGTAWWLAVGMYALLAHLRRRPVFEAIATCLTPVALLLTLTRTPLETAWYGVCLVGLAAVYQILAARTGRTHRSPLIVVASVLAVLGPAWAVPALLSWALVAALLADAVLYALLALGSRSTSLAFVGAASLSGAFVLGMHLAGWRVAQPHSWLVLSALLGIGAEVLLRVSGEHTRPLGELMLAKGKWRAVFAPAAFDLACLSAAVTVGLTPLGNVQLASGVLLLVAAGAAATTWTRHGSMFLYPATVLLAVGAALGLHAQTLPNETLWIGLLLTVLAAAYGVLGRQLAVAVGQACQWPLWVSGLCLSVLGPTLAVVIGSPDRRASVAVACVAIFAAALAVIRRPAWAYPVVIWVFVAFELSVRAVWPALHLDRSIGLLVVPTCAAFAAAEWLGHRRLTAGRVSSFALVELARSAWAQPMLIAAVLGAALSLVTAATDPLSGLVACAAYAAVMAVLAVRHGTMPGERWLALGLVGAAALQALTVLAIPRLEQPAFYLAGALVLALLSLASERAGHETIRAWRVPLLWSTAAVALAGEVLALSQLPNGLRTASVTTALTGLVVLTHAYTRRSRQLAYSGVGALLLASLLEIAGAGVAQPHAYVAPVAVYLAVLALLEHRRGDPGRVKPPLELAALLVLLGTTLLQSLGVGAQDVSRYAYEVGLIVEGLAVLGLGAVLHWWRSLLGGTAAVVMAVLIMLAEPLAHVDAWYLVGSIGLLLIAGVVFLERRRQQIPVWLDGWRERLEAWA